MSAASLVDECRKSGVMINLDGGLLKLKGAPNAVRIAADRLRPFKMEIMQFLAKDAERCDAVLPDRIQNPTNDIPASNDEAHFTARLHLFVACGLSLDDAQAMAHRMRIRDSQRDERRLCLECLHLSGSVTARRCGQWRKTGMKGAPFPADLATILQRCPGFEHRLKIDR